MSPSSPNAVMNADLPERVESLSFVRMPILDRDAELFAYDISDRGNQDTGLIQALLQGQDVTDQFDQLTGKHLAFVRVGAAVLSEYGERLPFNERLGPRILVETAGSNRIHALLQRMAARGVPLMADDAGLPAGMSDVTAERRHELVQLARCIGVDTRGHDDSTLLRVVSRVRAVNPRVVLAALSLADHRAHRASMDLGFDTFEGPYLFSPPPPRALDAIKPNHLNVLRLLASVENPENGPLELEELIRTDAVLSYKLLSCVNSAYFNLPREVKSLRQAAVFFGTARLRNWVYALALGELDDAPPELLKQALVRARMAELLAVRMDAERREMAFTTGLFSLLDVIIGLPMPQVLAGVPVADAVRAALVEDRGPLAGVLARLRGWESGNVADADLGGPGALELAEAYRNAIEWAEYIYGQARRAA